MEFEVEAITEAFDHRPFKQFQLEEIAQEDMLLIDYIKNLPNGKTSGKNKITYRALTSSPSVVNARIAEIANAIIRTGYYPSRWKLSQVITTL